MHRPGDVTASSMPRLGPYDTYDVRVLEQHALVTLMSWSRGFLLADVNSFNEWHEGSQFEPAKDYAHLTADKRRIGYHNPPDGMARLRHLRSLIDGLKGIDPSVARAANQ